MDQRTQALTCVVCEHKERDHIMHQSGANSWRGDYCTVCQQWCKETR